jgi:hypothetical protein
MILRETKIKGLKFAEERCENPSFTWNGGVYNFKPSITDFNRSLETGGFTLVRLMTATVRLYDYVDGELVPLFTNGLPQPQQKITYTLDGITYRIESIKLDTTGAYFRIICHSITKGI